MRYLLLFCVFLFSFQSMAATKEVVGQFVKISWGDYQHLVLNVDKKEVSFWCSGKSEGIGCDDIEKSPQKFKGKTLKVQYKIEKEFIPQAQSKVAIEKVVNIKIIK